MKQTASKPLRCAIYTRVSTEHGLEQDFNSLHAQREASEAYIKSQAHEGWRLVPGHFDDGGFSGGNLDRPALQQLLELVRGGRVDVVVVYKVDRLTRSLSDFARLVELFDLHGVSFVSVTQSFNTTTSMGRLTLNVLLSFAQFEREVTGERIRDKIAASKQKGIWMGGTVPLGYRVESRKLLIEESEADTVRLIFRLYLEAGSLPKLQRDLRERGILTRRRELSSGKIRGGVPLTNGPLNQLLKNRTYVGEINHKGRSWPGEHQPIIDPEMFGAVQAKLAANLNAHGVRRSRSESLLLGRIYDDRGNRMTPTHATKGPARYRYYVSSVLAQGRTEEAGSVHRVPAPDIEQLVLSAMRSKIAEAPRTSLALNAFNQNSCADAIGFSDQELVTAHLDRVTIQSGCIRVEVVRPAEFGEEHPSQGHLDSEAAFATHSDNVLLIPWSPAPSRRRRAILLPADVPAGRVRPMRDAVRANLLESIAHAKLWMDQLVCGELAGIEELARKEDCTERSARQMLNLAFIAPRIVRAIHDGALPRGIGFARLAEVPAEWDKQYTVLGIANLD